MVDGRHTRQRTPLRSPRRRCDPRPPWWTAATPSDQSRAVLLITLRSSAAMVDGRHPATVDSGAELASKLRSSAATGSGGQWWNPRDRVAILGRHGGRPPPGTGTALTPQKWLRSSAAMVDGR